MNKTFSCPRNYVHSIKCPCYLLDFKDLALTRRKDNKKLMPFIRIDDSYNFAFANKFCNFSKAFNFSQLLLSSIYLYIILVIHIDPKIFI